MAEFSYKIEKDLGIISENGDYSTHLTLTAWNNKPVKYDIRSWKSFDNEDERKCGKGITFTKEELIKLREILNGLELEG